MQAHEPGLNNVRAVERSVRAHAPRAVTATSTLSSVRTDIQRSSRCVAKYHLLHCCGNIAVTFLFRLDLNLILLNSPECMTLEILSNLL
jgi:hypothetical protein